MKLSLKRLVWNVTLNLWLDLRVTFTVSLRVGRRL